MDEHSGPRLGLYDYFLIRGTLFFSKKTIYMQKNGLYAQKKGNSRLYIAKKH